MVTDRTADSEILKLNWRNYIYWVRETPLPSLSCKSQGTEPNLAGLPSQLIISLTSFIFLHALSLLAAVFLQHTPFLTDWFAFWNWAAVCGKMRIQVRVVAVMLASRGLLEGSERDCLLPALSFRVICVVSGPRNISLPLDYCKPISKCVYINTYTSKRNKCISLLTSAENLLSNSLWI
jgi:hypothetical protein